MRAHTIVTSALVALLICSIPGSTQTVPPTTAGLIERAFADVETRRMSGDCADRDRRLTNLNNFLAPMIADSGTAFSPQIKEEYRTRLTEAAARRCPAASRPAAMTPLPRTMTLDDVRAEFAGSCGAAFHPARERLVAALDRSVRIERDPGRRAALEKDRARVIALPYRSCGTPLPSPTQAANANAAWREVENLGSQIAYACGDRWSVLRLRLLAALDQSIALETEAVNRGALMDMRAAYLRRDPPACEKPAPPTGIARLTAMQRWSAALMDFDRELLAAERARYAGSCTERSERVALARQALDRIRQSGYTPPRNPYNHAEQLRQHVAKRCNPRRSQTTAASPVPPGGLRMCRAIDYHEVRLGRPITCRCERVEQYLSIWGSNPYSSFSTICNAAVHAGVLPPNGVGVVRTVPVPYSEQALGSLRNGISSSNWDHDRENGFTFSAGGSVSE